MASSNKFDSALAKAEKNWKTAKDTATRGSEFEDGDYSFDLKEAVLKTVGKAAGLFVEMAWQFKDGDYKGKVFKELLSVDDEARQVWLARRVAALGYDLDGFSLKELPKLLSDINESGFEVNGSLTSAGGYQNFRLKEITAGGDAGAGGGDGGGDAEFEKGDEVKWKEGNKKYTGTVKLVDGTDVIVVDDNGKKHTVEASDLEKVDADPAPEAETVEFEKGDDVEIKQGKKWVPGTFLKYDKDDAALVQTESGKISLDKDEVRKAESVDPEPEPEEEKGGSGGDFSEGDKCFATLKGEKEQGKILEIDGDFARVEIKSTGKIYRIGIASLKAK